MINIRTLKGLKENDGLTLKNGIKITFKTGYQVATEGIETKDPPRSNDRHKALQWQLRYLV